jgi:hypothetical protein
MPPEPAAPPPPPAVEAPADAAAPAGDALTALADFLLERARAKVAARTEEMKSETASHGG